MNHFKSNLCFTSDDFEKFIPVIIEKRSRGYICTYKYCFQLLMHMINLCIEYWRHGCGRGPGLYFWFGNTIYVNISINSDNIFYISDYNGHL